MARSRQQQKTVSAKGRFTVTSQKRALDLDSLDTVKQNTESTLDPESSRLFCLLDVVQDSENKDELSKNLKSDVQDDVKMVRISVHNGFFIHKRNQFGTSK